MTSNSVAYLLPHQEPFQLKMSLRPVSGGRLEASSTTDRAGGAPGLQPGPEPAPRSCWMAGVPVLANGAS